MKPHDELFREMVSEPEAQRDMIRICLPDLARRIDLDTVTAIDATMLTGLHEAGDSDTVPFTTDLVYRLVDLRTIEPERLRLATRTLAFLITLRHVFRRLKHPTARRLVETLGTLPIGVKTRIRLFEYLLFNMPKENTGLLVTELEEREYTMEGGEAIMTVAQELRRQGREEGLKDGREEGLKDGREEGREEATHDVARKMLEKGISIALIIETTGLTAKQVAALQNGESKKPSSLG